MGISLVGKRLDAGNRAFGLALLGLVAASVIYLCLGAMRISLTEVLRVLTGGEAEQMSWLVVRDLRLPRVLLAWLIGSGLALSGATQQAVFRNPLADPGLLGVTTGAALGASVFILVAGGTPTSPVVGSWIDLGLVTSAFVGGLLATALAWILSAGGRSRDTAHLLLGGIAVNTMCASAIGLIFFLVDDVQLRSITFWTLGSIGSANWSSLLLLLPFSLVGLVVLPRLARALDLLQLGEADASFLGVDIRRVRVVAIVVSTATVAAAVAVAGPITFVGLVVPHLVRLVFGASHRIVLPMSALVGALLLTIADLLSRTLVAPAELPVGIVTSMVGAPFFAWLLFVGRSRRQA